MEREHLIKEIHDLAERIKTNTSDADSLLADVAHLYEMVILLKHLPVKKAEEKERADVRVEAKTNAEPDLFSTVEPQTAVADSSSKQPKSSESVAEKLSQKKVADLKSVIGINEKFQFINELFEGNMKEYNVALDQINNFTSLSEAVNYLANLKEVYKWSTDNAVASNFEKLVQRRFF